MKTILRPSKIRGGMFVWPDGRVRTSYTHNPSTLRLSSQDPNCQNLPRPESNPDDPTNIIRNLIVAQEGSHLYARDFSGIEAVLVGYFAMDPSYIRLAKQDVHTFYTVHALHALEGKIKSHDLPDLSWPDDRLFPYLAELKKVYKRERNTLYKHLLHGCNFAMTPKGAAEKIFSETRIMYPVKTIAKVMEVYFQIFPAIKTWHTQVLDEADKDGYLRNPFGYIHRFNRAYDYTWEYGEWAKKPGSDANKIIAFKAQSTAAAIIKEALMRLYYNRFEEAGKYLRLQVHDELLLEVPRDQLEEVDRIVKEEMERPIPELPLPKSWGMGDNLVILTEAKCDLNTPSRWGRMSGWGL